MADGIKNLLKEDLIPSAADAKLFSLAPYVVFMGFLCTFVVIPFGGGLIVADLDIGILYILAVTSLVVVGILMAGWSSNNKWSLLGGMRSAAQIVSYEIPAGLSILTIVFLAGTMSMQGIIKSQGWAPWDWFLFNNPFTFAAFFLYFTAALAEGNRMRTALLAAVSHDLRTPLASAKAAVTSLRSPDVNWDAHDRDELLATADESLDKLAHLVDNLLDMSRLQAGALSLFPRPAGLEEIVSRALDNLDPAGRGIRSTCGTSSPAT